ncbi:MAG: cupin domain-containing protein [Burkholderiales bacterium]|nr:cupin domain-containing protein [Burkholderiales bacterium]
MNIHQIDWSKMDWQPVREGVDRKAFTGQGATVALHRLMPGHKPSPHKHPHEQIVYIIAGQIRFHVGDEETVLGPGGLLVVPPDTMHWGEVVGNEAVLNLDVFTPARPEYV